MVNICKACNLDKGCQKIDVNQDCHRHKLLVILNKTTKIDTDVIRGMLIYQLARHIMGLYETNLLPLTANEYVFVDKIIKQWKDFK